MDSNIDVIVVKYTSTELDKRAYDNFMTYLKSVVGVNIHVHDNNINNIGLSKARNNLIKKCSTNFVCFCDYDIIPQFIDWNKIILKLNNKNVGIISPVTTKFSTVNKTLEWQNKEYISCNMMFMRTDTFKKIGMFDERFFVAYADWDIVKKVQLANLNILQHNKSFINHFGLSRYRPNKSSIWRKDFSAYVEKWSESGVLDRSKK
jgi:glycosyltransferase involved in cell wall biosynthesis